MITKHKVSRKYNGRDLERREKVMKIITCQKFVVFIPVARTWDKVERRMEERISG